MNQIDINSWGSYRLDDLFDFHLSKDDFQPKNLVYGSTPLISAGKEKNGIASYVKDDIAKKWDSGSITVDMFGKAFYQNTPFFCVSHGRVNILTPKKPISSNVGLYLACVIETVASKKYQFSEMCTGRKLREDIIKLPIDNNGKPDWQYMEEYMKNIESEVTSKIDKFQMILGNEKHKIDTQKWGGYRIGDLFEIKISKSVNKIDLNFTCDGKYDFIGRTSTNNGVQGHIEQIKISPNSKQTFSVAQIGENVCLYRDNEWYSSQNIFCLTPKYIELIQCNKFITPVITKQLKATFGLDAYSNYPTLKTLSTLIIKLPTQDGKPDWDYMENYINNIKCKVCQNVSSMEGVDANG